MDNNTANARKLAAAIELIDIAKVREWAIRNTETILQHHTFPEKQTALQLSTVLLVCYTG